MQTDLEVLHPDHLPNDAALIVPTLTQKCVNCGDDLYNLWDAQCCRQCLKLKVKEEKQIGLESKRCVEDYKLQPGDLIVVWWRGNLSSMFMRMVLATGEDEGRLWLVVLDPITSRVSCWGSHTVQININACLRGGQLGIQRLL